MKDNTARSAYRLRVIAGFVLAIGILFAVLLVSIGVAGILSDKILSYKNAANLRGYAHEAFRTLSNLGGLGCVIVGLIIFWNHFVGFVIMSAFATFIENSDRSDVVEALENINETLVELKNNKNVNNRINI